VQQVRQKLQQEVRRFGFPLFFFGQLHRGPRDQALMQAGEVTFLLDTFKPTTSKFRRTNNAGISPKTIPRTDSRTLTIRTGAGEQMVLLLDTVMIH
jgi:hypothetical protein